MRVSLFAEDRAGEIIKGPYISTKEPCVSAKEPCISAKERHTTRESYKDRAGATVAAARLSHMSPQKSPTSP